MNTIITPLFTKTLKQYPLIFYILLSAIWQPGIGWAQVNSGSTGSDGALDFSGITGTTNIVVDMHDHPTGVYNFTYVNIPSTVTVTFIPNANNTPVTWLVQSNCEIDGTVDASGQNIYAGAKGGPGGWAGGASGNNPTPGQGPGGGSAGYTSGSTNFYGGQASFGTVGEQGVDGYGNQQAPPGAIYGNKFLVPLIGGSGGGGGYNTDIGAGGGGAILIAANTQINIVGSILANGGDGSLSCGYLCNTSGSGGSGGAVRLVSTIISGSGIVSVNGGSGYFGRSLFTGYSGGNPESDSAGSGRIRFDTFQNDFSGNASGVFSQGYQPIIIPVAGQGVQLSIASVSGVSISAAPSGQPASPDAIISGQQANPISVVVNCSNLPLDTPITITVNPANASPVSALGFNTAGTLASSTAVISLNMPRGGGIIYATAATGN